MTEEQWLVMTNTDTSHLLAISELHIGLVAGLIHLLTRWFWSLIGRFSMCLPVKSGSSF